MTTARLRVRRCGPLTTLQDAGRTGWRRFGVTMSGPIDSLAYRAALSAVGALQGQTVVEISSGGIELDCVEGAVGFALCGAEFEATLDGVLLGAWSTATLSAGARLGIASKLGNWACLGFSGHLAAEEWLGSTATHALSRLGGGVLEAGREILVEGASSVEPRLLPRPPDHAPIVQVRAVLGPQERFFSADVIDRLTSHDFFATAALNRMGLVLDGPVLPPLRVDMVSEPATLGAMQVDGRGVASLLLADHQTTGGYPKIATVLKRDAERIAQLAPGASFRITLISADEAISIARSQAQAEARFLAEIAQNTPLAARLLSSNLITAKLCDDDA